MDNFKYTFDDFIWQRLDPALAKDKEHVELLDKINCNGESERLGIIDFSNVVAEVSYRTGLRDGMRLASELGVATNE